MKNITSIIYQTTRQVYSVEDKIAIIRKNQIAQICERFISSNPKSKCSLCGKHYLTHSNSATKHMVQGLPNQLKLF